MSTNTQAHDPTAQGAHSKGHDLTPQQKIDTLLEITKHIGTGMLTRAHPMASSLPEPWHPPLPKVSSFRST